MSLILCIATIITVDWNRSEIRSSPMVIPCTGFDHVIRLELVTVPTQTEFHEFEQVLQMSAIKPLGGAQAENFERSGDFIGPRTLGHHYASMLQEDRTNLYQNQTARLFSITEKVDYSQYSQVHRLKAQLEQVQQPILLGATNEKIPSRSSSTMEESVSQIKPETPILTASGEVSPFSNARFSGARLLSRQRRGNFGTTVDTTVKTDLQVENKRQNQKTDSDNQESKTTGGGYGSQTCINSQFTAWNNSTFTSGTCGCECPTCPSCNTATFINMAEKANSERQEVQSKLTECQGQLLQRPTTTVATTLSTSPVCNKGEIRRLKEETRHLRARMRRMTSTRTEMGMSPSTTKSTFVSSLEAAGAVLVDSAIDYTSKRRSNSGGTNVSTQPSGSSEIKPRTTSRTATTTSRRLVQTNSKRRNRPSKIPVSKGRRVPAQKTSRSHSKTRAGSKNRGRRSLEVLQQSLERYNPWSSQSEPLHQRHFVAAEKTKRVRAGNGVSLVMMNPVQKYNTSRIVDRVSRLPNGLVSRTRRDTHDSHFTGSANSADVSAFEKATFKGSTEIRHDNSTNIRDFRPNLSPEINIETRGKNETLISKSHNGNDIKIVNSPPCVCEDNLDVIMTAIGVQISLTVVLTISVVLHYHVHRCVSHKKKKDLDLLKMQAHLVYQRGKSSRHVGTPIKSSGASNLQPNYLDNRDTQFSLC